MPKMNLSHFEAAFLFSVLVSVVLGVVTKNTDPTVYITASTLSSASCSRCSVSAG